MEQTKRRKNEPVTQLALTCSESTIETIKKVYNMFKANNKKHQDGAIDVVLVFLLLTLNIFYTFF